MTTPATKRLYLEDDSSLSCAAVIEAVSGNAFVANQTCFYPGGGGQPSDTGYVAFDDGEERTIIGARCDDAGAIWHETRSEVPIAAVKTTVTLTVDHERRDALTRYHTVLHIVNTIVLRDYNAWITGAQITPEYARIDFNLDSLDPVLLSALEVKVNSVIASGFPLRAYSIAVFDSRTLHPRQIVAKPRRR